QNERTVRERWLIVNLTPYFSRPGSTRHTWRSLLLSHRIPGLRRLLLWWFLRYLVRRRLAIAPCACRGKRRRAVAPGRRWRGRFIAWPSSPIVLALPDSFLYI